MKLFRGVVFSLAILAARAAQSQDISLDVLSPEIPGVVPNASYIVAAYTLVPAITGAQLGLLAGEDETSFSYGRDHVIPPAIGDHAHLYYSVTRGSVGVMGSPVGLESAGNGAAGDIFGVLFNPNPNPPAIYQDAVPLGLTPLPGESNIDGLDILMNGAVNNFFHVPVYFTVDAAAAARWGFTQGDILFRPVPTPPGPPVPPVYATGAALGLAIGDVIDGLAINDAGVIGVLDAPDHVYISLALGSPSVGLYGSATVIEVFPAPIVRLTDAQLGLLPGDDVDAISINDPGVTEVGPPRGSLMQLGPGRPNPFRSSTTIEYALPLAGPTRLRVFDVSGRLVATLCDGVQSAGPHSISWSPSSPAAGVPKAGVYVMRLEWGGVCSARRLVCLR